MVSAMLAHAQKTGRKIEPNVSDRDTRGPVEDRMILSSDGKLFDTHWSLVL